MTAWDRLPESYRAQLERNAKNIPIARQKIADWHARHPVKHAPRGPLLGCPQPEYPIRERA